MDEGEFIAPLFAVYTGLLNSKYWCFAGKDMNDYGDLNENSNRTSVDESSLKNYTEKIIEELEDSMDEGNSDSAFHLETARAAMENGKYVAALVDAAYMQSYRDIEEMNETEFETSLDLLLEKNYTFVWPKMFRNHAKVISEEDGFSALRVALIADNIERYFGDAKSILSGTGLGYAIEPPSAELIQKSEEVLSYQIFAIVTVLAGIAFISYVLMKTGLLGDDSERPKNNGRTRRDRK